MRDLFVEGPRDRGLYSWYVAMSGYRHVAVFDIESVEVPHEMVVSRGLESGNRSRIIALALELDDQCSPVLRYVRCIADSDFDFIFSSRNSANHLLYTDYTSVDLYTCDEDLLRRVLWLGFNLPETEIQSLFDSMFSILQDIFIIRAANQNLGWGLAIVPFTRCCQINGPIITFDRSNFIDRCLDSRAKRNDRAMFEDTCTDLRSVSLRDPRQGIHSDDYSELIGWYLQRRRGWRGYSSGQRSIMSHLTAALDARLLSREKLFVQLDALFGE